MGERGRVRRTRSDVAGFEDGGEALKMEERVMSQRKPMGT